MKGNDNPFVQLKKINIDFRNINIIDFDVSVQTVIDNVRGRL